jgi:hypothetical protein
VASTIVVINGTLTTVGSMRQSLGEDRDHGGNQVRPEDHDRQRSGDDKGDIRPGLAGQGAKEANHCQEHAQHDSAT